MLKPVLRGIRIVEQGTFITGPCCGMMLADLGADVIKIEAPEGDPYRSYQGGRYSPHFQAYNRNKRSLVLDMKNTAHRGVFDQLIANADVYIQNFRPGYRRSHRCRALRACRSSTRDSCTAPSAASARMARTLAARATTRCRRLCPDS